MAKTQSEKWFEDFCAKVGLISIRIPEGSGKTPDYELTPDPSEITLYVYHTRYAAVPLDPALLARYASRQFALEDETPGWTAKFRELALSQ